MDERTAGAVRSSRELRNLRAQEKTAENLGRIADILGLWYSRTFPDCEIPAYVSPEENAKAMEEMKVMLTGVRFERSGYGWDA
jgi:hypothetical protein